MDWRYATQHTVSQWSIVRASRAAVSSMSAALVLGHSRLDTFLADTRVVFLRSPFPRRTSHFRTPVVRDGRSRYTRRTIVNGFSQHLFSSPKDNPVTASLHSQANYAMSPHSAHCQYDRSAKILRTISA